uniref:BACK domain-containing protein n=1 Tax=Mucochytrium quahogii TaxID=96639 RepID=A0A7S2RH86_9STRA|mmetsp:Transcript_6780/g.10737  ORF Transcript_6780/g.10737 Transcript_6780/m.10737 type:complete len:730 (+) Transcript_6780:337-2526(+)
MEGGFGRKHELGSNGSGVGTSGASKRPRVENNEYHGFEEFLGTIPAEPVSALGMMSANDAFATVGKYENGDDFVTITTPDHCLVMAQRLADMARNDECCDLEIVICCGKASKGETMTMHSVYACASSRTFRNLVMTKVRKVPVELSTTSGTAGKKDRKNMKSPSANSISGDTDSCVSSTCQKDADVSKDNKDNSDVCKNVTISATKIATTPRMKIEFHGVELATLELIRTYMYTGILQFYSDHICKIVDCAIYLEMDTLINLALGHVEQDIRIETVFEVLRISVKHRLHQLRERALRLFDQAFEVLVTNPQWKTLSTDLIREILLRDSLQVRNEITVFRAVAKWTQEDPKTRESEFLKFAEDPNCLRLSNMAREELIEMSQHELAVKSNQVRRILYLEAVARQEAAQGGSRANGNAAQTRDRQYGVPSVSCALAEPPLEVSVCERTIEGHQRAVCALTTVGNYVASACGDYRVRVFNPANDWRCEYVLDGHTSAVVALKSVGDLLISAGPDKTIRIWSTQTWECVHVIRTPKSSVCSLAVFDNKLITGGDDGTLKSWGMSGWGLQRTVIAHAHVIWSLARYRQDVLISGSSDTKISVWNVSRNGFSLITTLTQHKDEVQALAVDHQNDWLISGSDDGMVNIHSCKNWECLRTFCWQNRAVLSLVSYGNKIIAGLGNGDVNIWNKDDFLKSNGRAVTIKAHSSCVMALVVTGQRLVTGSYDRTVKVWGPS